MRHIKPVIYSYCTLLATLLLVLGGGAGLLGYAGEPPLSCISKGWPQDASDLQPDPTLRFGTLQNGLRYVLMENREPRGRVAMYLDVQAGSVNETDEQRGLAHFLEHMLFNGTTHFPPGTLVEYLQSVGMEFGADTNAHTSYGETVYKLVLPDNSEKRISEGLLIMADYARGALLLEEEVDRERGIILAEKRARDSARSRAARARMHFTFAGTRIAKRDIIGTEETLLAADSRLLRAYYDAWYRPENMILVVVGDMNPDRVDVMLREQLSGLQAAEVLPQCPDFGKVARKGTEVFYLHEPELGATQIYLESVWDRNPEPDTREWEEKFFSRYVATAILNNRLEVLTARPDSPLTSAQAYYGALLQRVGYTTLRAVTDGDQWEKSLALLTSTLKQALEYGFTPAELERVQREIMADLHKQVQTRASRRSSELASQLVDHLNDNQVFKSPEQEKQLYGALLKKMTLEEINQAFRDLWNRDNRLIEVLGNADLGQGREAPEQQILRTYNAALSAAVSPWVEEEASAFPYLSPRKEQGRVIGHTVHGQIDAETWVFGDGTRLHVKKTDFEPGEVRMVVSFGDGRLAVPTPGLDRLAESVVSESGLGRMTREQLARALAGRSAEIRFQVGEESFRISGKALSQELELLLQLVQAQLEDPGFRAEAYRLSMDRFRQMYDQMESSVEGMMQLVGEVFLAGGNQRYGMVDRKKFMALTLKEVEEWLRPILAGARLEISVVGDVDPEEVVALVSKYFGASRRTLEPGAKGEHIAFPAGKTLRRTVQTETEKALVVAAWETDDFWDISRTRRLSILASILSDRLRREVREKLGATYSPVVYNRSSRVDPGYGVLRSMIIVDPARADILLKRMEQVGADIARQGVSAEELQRALKPTLTSIRDMMRTNRYWLESVLVLSDRHPEQLQWPLSIQKDFASIRPEELAGLAEKYLGPDRLAGIVLKSETKP
ncbi:M16 family metallopeptidase [Desulfolithobacter dissulfuricans]|uniref:M16 family metallopeptidase n=1 Tax=Desulfolithobacter dissulfuricans TaxID=2795293 RepID=UPI00227759E5|nr:insulinase family protein [Desulfolithobacter dissulfuricans]